MRFHILTLLATLSLRTALAQSTCTTSNATPIDADVAFVAFVTVFAVDWVAIALWVKRSEPAPLIKRALTCSSAEQCLSFRTVPFCYNRATFTFHAVDGTSGNFKTGEYTLPDGRVGNMYTGPYPTMTSAGVGATSAAQPATSADQPTTTATESTTSATEQTAESTKSIVPTSSINAVQHPSTSSTVNTGNGGATSTLASVVATQSSALVLKSGGTSVRQSPKISLIDVSILGVIFTILML